MRYVKASDALKALQASLTIAAPDSAYAGDQQNEIVLAGSEDFLGRAAAVIANVDRPGQQVRYEVRVTELTPTESSNIGFLFGGVDVNGSPTAGSGSTVTTFVNKSLAINATINAMVADGSAQVLARPSISSLNNVPASLLVGQQYPIVYFDARTGTQQVQFVNVGVNLNVTPTIGIDGMITTDLETDYSQVTGTIANFPIISTRKAQSTLRVHDGETIVIAGLFADIDSNTLTKVPFLGDIPIIGEIFRNRARNHSKDEVVFLITPHLVIDGDPANGTTAIPIPPPSS
jgi:type II secretory pathway component GspD/PulD (secretin)